MTEVIGREVEVGVATEASRGSAESNVDKWMKNVVANIVERAEHAQDDSTHGVLEDMDGRRVVQKYIEGDMSGIVHADVIGYLYSSLYGKLASSQVSGSVYDHVFTLKQSVEHQTLTVFAKDGDAQQVKFAGCMVSSLELNASVDDYLRFSADFMGRTATDDTSTPSYDTEYDFVPKDIVVKIADSEAGLAGASALSVKDLTITHDQGAIRDHVLGSETPEDIYNAKHSIEGEIMLNFNNETYKDLYLGDSAKYMSITITGTSDIGSGNYPTITYILNKVLFNDWNRAGGNDELVTQPISFKAYYNASDGEASQVTVRNLTSSYANVPSN